MNAQKWLAIGLISLSALAVGVGPAQASPVRTNQDAKTYRAQLKPGLLAFSRTAFALDREVNKAPQQTDGQIAVKFTALTNRFRKSGRQIAAVKAPAAFRARQRAVTGSIRLITLDTGRIARAARAHDAKKAKRYSVALTRHLKRATRALNALGKGLDAAGAAA